MWHRALWPNLLWWLAQAPAARRFDAALRRPQPTQQALLLTLVRASAGTAYGREYGFQAISSVNEFQRRVPLSTYEDYEPWVTRIRAGETSVLTGEVVTHLVPTSGSTAAAKLLPYTRCVQREFAAAIAPWIFDLFQQHPEWMAGPAYWAVTPSVHTPSLPSVVPIGFDADTDYLGGCWSRVVESVLAVPKSAARNSSVTEQRRATLLALLSCRELRLISVWHPSFLTLLLEAMEEGWEELLSALPEPGRAAELRACGPRAYRAIWPRLGLISCWADGPAAGPAFLLRNLMSGVELQPKGLLATEAFVSVPYRGMRPLAIRSHFFEFLDQAGGVFLAHELQEGVEYSVVVTTGGGLYRYRMQDRIRVEGFLRGTPSIQFVGKEDGISDLCGEKLAEPFVSKAISEVLGLHGIQAMFVMLVPEPVEPRAHYTLFVETHQPIPATFADRLESRLCENPHYRWCIELGQLSRVRVERVSPGAFSRYAAWSGEAGVRLGQVKPRALASCSALAEALRGMSAGPET